MKISSSDSVAESPVPSDGARPDRPLSKAVESVGVGVETDDAETVGAETDADAEHNSDHEVDHDLDDGNDDDIDDDAWQPRHNETTGSRAAQIGIVILTILAVLYTAYFAKAILMPITLAVIMSMMLRPIVTTLGRWHVPHIVTASLLFALVVCGFIAAFFLLAQPAKEWLAGAPDTLSEVRGRFESYTSPLTSLQQAKEKVDEITTMSGEEKAIAVRVEQPALTSRLLNTTGSYAASVTIASSLLFFLLVAGDRFLEKTVEVMPNWQAKWDAVLIARDIEKKISIYLGAITLINVGLGITIGLGLWLIGMPNPVLWGALAGGLNFIPFAGLVIGTVIVGLTALVTFDSLGHAMLAPLIYLIANGIEANLVTPAILGKSIDLNPVMILLAVFLGGWIWGITGIFLAVPLLIVARITCEHYDSLKPVAVYLTS